MSDENKMDAQNDDVANWNGEFPPELNAVLHERIAELKTMDVTGFTCFHSGMTKDEIMAKFQEIQDRARRSVIEKS